MFLCYSGNIFLKSRMGSMLLTCMLCENFVAHSLIRVSLTSIHSNYPCKPPYFYCVTIVIEYIYCMLTLLILCSSGGNKRKLSTAVALVGSPQIVLLVSSSPEPYLRVLNLHECL